MSRGDAELGRAGFHRSTGSQILKGEGDVHRRGVSTAEGVGREKKWMWVLSTKMHARLTREVVEGEGR